MRVLAQLWSGWWYVLETNGAPPKPESVQMLALQPEKSELASVENDVASTILAKRTRSGMVMIAERDLKYQGSLYADKQGQLDMEACSPTCIAILKQQLKKLNGHSRARALDVAGGNGRVA